MDFFLFDGQLSHLVDENQTVLDSNLPFLKDWTMTSFPNGLPYPVSLN